MDKVSLNNYINVTSGTDTTASKTTESTSATQNGKNALCIQDTYESSESCSSENRFTTYTNQSKSINTTLDNTQVPANVFNYFESKVPEVSSIVTNLENTISSYINGNCSVDDIKSGINQTYTDILNYNISLGRTDGTKEEDKAQILECVNRVFVTAANKLCQKANSDEGDALAAEQGLKPTDPFVYYNSKYYYAFSDIKKATNDATETIASGQKLADFSVEESESKIAPTLADFNEYWSGNAQNNKKICAMLDTTEEPPESFIMFYSQSTEYADKTYTGGDINIIDDGQITVSTGDQR